MAHLRSDLPLVSAKAAATAGYAALDSIQTMTPAQQVTGVALLFTAMCETAQLDPSQLINASARRLRDADNFVQPEIRALREYIKQELVK